MTRLPEGGRSTLLLALLPALLAAAAMRPAIAAPDEPAPPAERSPTARRIGFGLAAGYAHGFAGRDRQQGKDVADVSMLVLAPHLRLPLAELGSGLSWYHGRLEGLLEGSLLVNFEPHSGHAGGVVLGLRHRFLPGWRIHPYVEGGIGIGRLAFDLRSQDDGANFLLQAGLGLRWPLGRSTALTGAVRWHHISNAQSRMPNNGIDDIGFLLGVEYR